MTAPWIRKLVAQVWVGQPTPLLERHLDDILIWLGNASHDITRELDHAFARAGLSREDAVARTQRLLDRRLFIEGLPPHRLLGLPADATAAVVRQRYRRLIQAFHPDRHPARSAWLTQRTELINIAYGHLRHQPRSERPPSSAANGSVNPPKQSNRRWPKPRTLYYQQQDGASGPPLMGRLRAWLGASRSFQVRFFGLLITGCVILLLYLFYINGHALGRFWRMTPIGEPEASQGRAERAPQATVPVVTDAKGKAGIAPVTFVESH